MAKQLTRRKTADLSDKIIDSALALAAERGWKKLSLLEIAAAADVSLPDLYQLYSSKSAILAGFSRRTDAIVLAGMEADGENGEETPQDRLFDVLMRRFDALAPYKAGVKAIARDLPADPMALLVTLPQLGRSFSWMLMAAGLRSDGVRGLVRVKMLLALWFATMRVWFGDDDPEHG
ncbi:MAG: TetR/AcrR family transcriptional regulator, partial [Alphaproteobacteria bacterium]